MPIEREIKKKDPQVADFLRLERKGVCSISAISSKGPSERDHVERQFFVMFLKMRVSFFKDFDKKTIRGLMDRINTVSYNRN